MTNDESDYSRLLPIRDQVFPSFAADQEGAVATIVANISPLLNERRIDSIVDLGCGTAEILDSMRKQQTAFGRGIKCLGVDCCAAEIEIARKLRTGCDFVEQRAEDFMRSIATGRSDFTPASTLLICIGHTLTHFHDMAWFLDNVAMWGPALLLIDFFEEWNRVVRHFDQKGASPIQQLKQSRRSFDGTIVTHTLTTKRDPGDADRVLRGVETFGDVAATTTPFWTTQLRKGTAWFLAEIKQRGYASEKHFAYRGGYGPMTGYLLSREINTIG